MFRHRKILCAALAVVLFAGTFTCWTPLASAVPPNQGWDAQTIGEWNTFWTDFVNFYVTFAKQYGWTNASTLWTKAYINGLANWKANGYAYVNGWPLAFWDGFVAYIKVQPLTPPSSTTGATAYADYIIWHLDFAPAGYPVP